MKAGAIPFKFNPWKPPSAGPVGILAGASTLAWATRSKSRALDSGLVVGPNVSILASELHKQFTSDRVRKIIVPSEWVRQHWARDCPEVSDKLVIWACGIDLEEWAPTESPSTDPLPLIYIKIPWPRLVERLRYLLASQDIRFREVRYGSYSRNHYRQLLNQSSCLVYIGGSESQGLALLEAWGMNVPTFVYDAPSQVINLTAGRVEFLERGEFSPAPYLTSDTGALWTSPYDLLALISGAANFRPRSHVVEQWSDEIRARAYARILDDVNSVDKA